VAYVATFKIYINRSITTFKIWSALFRINTEGKSLEHASKPGKSLSGSTFNQYTISESDLYLELPEADVCVYTLFY